MKCPKCGYLGFEEVERCRNCGYDFSLTAEPALQDLSIRRSNPTPHPLDDLSLVDRAAAPAPPRMTDVPAEVDRVFGAPEPAEAGLPSARARVPRVELPLFRHATADDEPLITKVSPPRAPLAVRRSTPEVPRARTERSPLLRPDDRASAGDPGPDPLMLDSASKAFFHLLAHSGVLKKLASRYGMRRSASFARRRFEGFARKFECACLAVDHSN